MKVRLTVELEVEAEKELTLDMALWIINNLYFRTEAEIERKLPDYGKVKVTRLARAGREV